MEFSNEIIRSLGMTVVHSLWQGAIIAVLILFMLGLTGKSNARARYAILFTGLMLLLCSFISTFLLVCQHIHLPPIWSGVSENGITPANDLMIAPWPLQPGSITGWVFGYLEPYYPFLAICWMAGFIVMGARMAGIALFTRVQLRRYLELPDPSLQRIFNQLQESLELSVFVRLRITARKVSPLVIGFFKPVVILPAAAITGLSTAQIEAVLIHELAHIRRFDHVMILLQAFAGQVLFFHPAAWFFLKEIDRERENCCDDIVVKTKSNPINYIKALTMIQEMSSSHVVPVNALTGKSNHLLNRIKRLVKPELKYSPAFRLAVMLLFFATIGLSAMTLIYTGKPGNLVQAGILSRVSNKESGLNEKTDMNVTVNAVTQDKQDGEKKKMKIVFVNDTIKEMTVNGKSVKPEEMEAYEDEIMKIRQEMELSQKELERTQRELEEAQIELERARKEIDESREKFDQQELESEINRELHGALTEIPFTLEHFKNTLQNDEFREQMRRTQEEVRRAMEEMRIKQREYWQSHQEEFREQMKKAQEEARKAMEEWQKNNPDFFNREPFRHLYELYPPVPCPPEFNDQDLREIEELIPAEPEEPAESLEEIPELPDQPDKESINSKLKELEEEAGK